MGGIIMLAPFNSLENIAQKSYNRYLQCNHPLMVEQILDTVNTEKQLKYLDHWKDVFKNIPEIYAELLKL